MSAEVLLLGTPHLANPGRDLINIVVDDVLAPARQRELEELTMRLAAFRPTKICVEVTPGRQDGLDELFAGFLEGRGEPKAGEVHQIAFRLAQQQGLNRVLGVDDDAPMEWNGLEDLFDAQPQLKREFQEWTRKAQIEAQHESERLARTPLQHYLLEVNDPERLLLDAAWYVDMAGLGGVGEHAGARMLTSWYRRNIAIFSNVCGHTEPGDRLFILLGVGHVPILRQLLSLSSRHTLVDLPQYLR
ncbi:MAG: DUF5694 domain-containing protein [Actinomycetota bacterium]